MKTRPKHVEGSTSLIVTTAIFEYVAAPRVISAHWQHPLDPLVLKNHPNKTHLNKSVAESSTSDPLSLPCGDLDRFGLTVSFVGSLQPLRVVRNEKTMITVVELWSSLCDDLDECEPILDGRQVKGTTFPESRHGNPNQPEEDNTGNRTCASVTLYCSGSPAWC